MPARKSLYLLSGIAGGESHLLTPDEGGFAIFRENAVDRSRDHVLPLGIRLQVDGGLPEIGGEGVLWIVYPDSVALQGRLYAYVGKVVYVQFGDLELSFHVAVQVAAGRYPGILRKEPGQRIQTEMDVSVHRHQRVSSQDVVRRTFQLDIGPLDVHAEILDFSHKLSVPGAGGGFQVETSGLVDAFPTDMGFRDREVDGHLRKPAGILVVIAVAMAVRRKQGIRLQFLQYREILSEILGNVAHRLVFHRNVSLYVHAVQRHVHQTFAGQVDGRHRCLQVLDFEEFLLEVRSKLT